jgi:predicted ATPase/class 3 adenylate cyclase
VTAEQLTGTLTFLFTDVQGSARLWETFPNAMRHALKRHDAILRAAIEGAGGQIVKTTGDGFMAVFASPRAAVTASLRAQQDLQTAEWPDTGPLRVRMSVHAGEAEARGGDYFGPTVNRAARIMASGHGGQVLVSGTAAALVAEHLPDGTSLRDLGDQRLKDLGRAEHVFQLVDPSLAADFPPLATLNHRPNNLPTQTSGFVGRETELVDIGNRLDDDAVRLLTLTGPGGTGKTRLALRAAADRIDRFDDGVFFIDLSEVRDADSMLVAIARALGISETTDRSITEELTAHLRERHMLLVLDNFEQVTRAAPTAAQLLRDCPRLKLLVTTREPLHVRGEHLFAVPPLSMPVASRGAVTAAQLTRFEAIQLFVERAREVKPDFNLTDANARAVVDICMRLDGLPLAIELATARINLFSPQALLDRLRGRPQLLRGGARDLPERQQTLRATIDWSYQLLEPDEQRLFELLSVFAGGTFETVTSIAAGIDRFAESDFDSFDGLASLLDKSLLRRSESRDDEPRVEMLETIRDFAAERLAELPEFRDSARRAHASWFAAFAERQWRELTGAGREPALAAMAADKGNLRNAWACWVAERDLDQLNKMVDSLWFLYDARGWYRGTVELSNDLLEVLAATPSTPERAVQELTLRTSLARTLMAVRGYTGEVEEAYERALALIGDGPTLPEVFPVLRGLASFYMNRGEFPKATLIGEQIIRLGEQENDASMLVDGHLVLGATVGFTKNLRGGLEHLDQAITYFEVEKQRSRRFRAGNHAGVACFTTSAFYLWVLGFPDRARDRIENAVTVAEQLSHPYSLAYALFHCGLLYLWRREYEQVRERADGVLAVVDDHDFPIWRALGTVLRGAATTGMGLHEEGVAEIRRGKALYEGLRTPPVFWPMLLFLQAGSCLQAGRVKDGLGLIDQAIGLADVGPGMMLVPEFNVLKGDLVLAGGNGNGEAETIFRHAYDGAVGWDARMSQLRAAIRLGRLLRDRGNGAEARLLLSSIQATFAEGQETLDLKEAADLMSSLS